MKAQEGIVLDAGHHGHVEKDSVLPRLNGMVAVRALPGDNQTYDSGSHSQSPVLKKNKAAFNARFRVVAWKV